MSRIGLKPITVPAGVDVKISGQKVTVSKGNVTMEQVMNEAITAKMEGNVVSLSRKNDEKEVKALHGLYRALIANMVTGVSEGFKKELEIQGVGYRAQLTGKNLVMNLGYSHDVTVVPPEGITFEVPQPNQIIVKGYDKQVVGQTAAEIREKRPPEPYKGKGIRYVGEYVAHKEGKAGKGTK